MKNLFTAGEEGYGSYRIPALLKLNNGRLLAFCEAREILSDHAHNKLVMRWSDDHGATWSTMKMVADAGDNALNNPLLVQDKVSNDVILMYQYYPFIGRDEVSNPERWISHKGQNFPSNIHEGAVTEGYEGRICRTFIKRSSDNGETWSEAQDITEQVKRPTEVTCYAGGPGIGIQLTQGALRNRIVMPFTQGPWDNMKTYVVYSDDQGFTWQYGATAPAPSDAFANETQVAEIAEGRLHLNSRSYQGNKCRKVTFSDDGGASWEPLRDACDLPEPECQASLLSVFTSEQQHQALLYCGPSDTQARRQGELKISNDGGEQWSLLASIYTGFFGYSSICQISPTETAVLFERDDYAYLSFTLIQHRNIEEKL